MVELEYRERGRYRACGVVWGGVGCGVGCMWCGVYSVWGGVWGVCVVRTMGMRGVMCDAWCRVW